MARGNQREKAREKNLKKTEVRLTITNYLFSRSSIQNILTRPFPQLQKPKTTMSGTQMQHAKESSAEIMRKKQAAAEARKAAEGKK
ncbi:unnamed protein product [Fusarium langsethiae]|nr:unnamed protein product [Fusarium langsethiae]